MIPKIIHYTWFSGEEMPPIVKDCIASWKRCMPDYEYRLWDLEAIQEIDAPFLTEALAARKWAFAADYVRLYALYHEGGIYLDTDVMVYKPLDEFLHHEVFIGQEDAIHELLLENNWARYLTSHCMGAVPQASYIQDCLRYFDSIHFVLSTDEQVPQRLRYNYVLLPYIQATIAREYGYDWAPKTQTVQQCKDGMTIYPSDYFCGYKHISTTYCEHLALGSWRNWDVCPTVQHAPGQFKRRIRKFLDRLLFIYSYVLIKVR